MDELETITSDLRDAREFLETQDAEIAALETTLRVLAKLPDQAAFEAGMRVHKQASRIRLERITTRSVIEELVQAGRNLVASVL